jgi:hypothetical protein
MLGQNWPHGGERKNEEKVVENQKTRGHDFFMNLDPIFFMIRPWNPPIFIGSGRG